MRLRGKAGANSLSHTHQLRSLSYGYRVAWLAQITRHARYNERYGVPTAYRPLHTDKGIFKSAPNEPHTGIESIQRIEVPLDPDLAEQAVVGHGVPSQDPSGAAQVSLAPEEAKREAKSALVGGRDGGLARRRSRWRGAGRADWRIGGWHRGHHCGRAWRRSGRPNSEPRADAAPAALSAVCQRRAPGRLLTRQLLAQPPQKL